MKKKLIIERIVPGAGDATMVAPLIEIAREKNPEAQIIVRTLEWIAPIFQSNPNIDLLLTEKDTPPPDAEYLLKIDALLKCPCVAYEVGAMPNIAKSRHQLHCEAAGYEYDGRPPKLYLNSAELEEVQKIRDFYQGIKIGIHLKSTEKYRTYPHTEMLIEHIRRKTGWHLFLIEKNHAPDIPGTTALIGRPIREIMVYLKAMDLVIGPDSGIIFLAGALSTPIYGIFGSNDPKMRIGPYGNLAHWNKEYKTCKRSRCWYQPCEKVWCLQTLSPQKIYKDAKKILAHLPDRSVQLERDIHYAKSQLEKREVIKQPVIQPPSPITHSTIALLRLDGLGGTLTLSDQAKKLKEKFDQPITLIIRQYAELFDENPFVDNVIVVGNQTWDRCLNEYKPQFGSLVDIRFAIPKWYGNGHKQLNFKQWEKFYEDFPIGHNKLEEHGLHHIQLTDKILKLPHDTIESKIYIDPALPAEIDNLLPEKFICITGGIDAIHKGKVQTKCWPHWERFVEMSHLPVVQVGTTFDLPIKNTIDLRGKTDLRGLMALLKKSQIIVTIEGGIMHLAYALGCQNTIILRGPTTGKLFEYPGKL